MSDTTTIVLEGEIENSDGAYCMIGEEVIQLGEHKIGPRHFWVRRGKKWERHGQTIFLNCRRNVTHA